MLRLHLSGCVQLDGARQSKARERASHYDEQFALLCYTILKKRALTCAQQIFCSLARRMNDCLYAPDQAQFVRNIS